MHRLIRWRIALPYLILLILSLAVFTGFVVNTIRQQEQDRWQSQSLATAQSIGLQAQGLFNEPGEAEALSQLILSQTEFYSFDITFLNLDGEIIATSLPAELLPQDTCRMLGVSQAIESGEGFCQTETTLGTALTIRDANGVPLGLIQLQIPVSYYQTDINEIVLESLAVVIMSLGGLIIIALFVRDLSLQPIASLTIAAQQMSMGNFTNLEFPENPQELKELSDALQSMANDLGAQIDAPDQ